ncbi:MAG TPA: hypothetical protein VNU64_23565 [Burkholderiales bacterium]|nr:hypothetical protein [Burkholderiales bacterium]
MRLVLGSLPRMVIMAAVVDSALFLPLGAILALLCFALFGVPLQSFVTFGGFVSAPEGLITWWAIFLLPSLVYAAYMMPWGGNR